MDSGLLTCTEKGDFLCRSYVCSRYESHIPQLTVGVVQRIAKKLGLHTISVGAIGLVCPAPEGPCVNCSDLCRLKGMS